MSEDEEAPVAEAEEEDAIAVAFAAAKTPPASNSAEDEEHEKEEIEELEAARKERTDLLAAELMKQGQKKTAPKERMGSKSAVLVEGEPKRKTPVVGAFDKFQFLVGQSEVFAHFLAGEFGGAVREQQH